MQLASNTASAATPLRYPCQHFAVQLCALPPEVLEEHDLLKLVKIKFFDLSIESFVNCFE